MSERAGNANLETLENVPDQFKTQEICEKVIDRKMYFFQYVTDRYKTKNCVKELLIIIPGQGQVFLASIRSKKDVKKL